MQSRLGSTLLEAFGIDANGDGAWREAWIGADMFDYDIVTKRVHGGPEGFARLRRTIERLNRRFDEPVPGCRTASPPDPVWTIRWAWGDSFGSIHFRFGCRDEAGQREIADLFDDVEDEVRDWAEPMPIAERYPFIGSR